MERRLWCNREGLLAIIHCEAIKLSRQAEEDKTKFGKIAKLDFFDVSREIFSTVHPEEKSRGSHANDHEDETRSLY